MDERPTDEELGQMVRRSYAMRALAVAATQEMMRLSSKTRPADLRAVRAFAMEELEKLLAHAPNARERERARNAAQQQIDEVIGRFEHLGTDAN